MKKIITAVAIVSAISVAFALSYKTNADTPIKPPSTKTVAPTVASKTASKEVKAIKAGQINQQAILDNAPKLDPKALQLAVNGYEWAGKKGELGNPDVLTVIDFNQPSNAKRLWVINLRNSKVLMNLYTTQGKNSGLTYAKKFSNAHGTDETSLGVYKTANTYGGEHGYSMRLQGLEQGINNNAMGRAVVIHSAYYATPAFVKAHGRAGRSWGCFAIDPAQSRSFIDNTKGGSVIFAYATPEQKDPNVNKA